MIRQFQRITAIITIIIVLGKSQVYALTGLIGYRDHGAKFLEKRYNENLRFRKYDHVPKTRLCMKIDDRDTLHSDSSNSSFIHQATTKIPILQRRIGGRRKRQRTNEKSTSLEATLKNILSKYRKVVLWLASAAFLWIVFFSRLFGGTGPSPNYVYYQSSVIERRVVGPDGNVETSRKESFKSNIPDLVRRQGQNSQSFKEMNEAELRRFDEQFRKNDEQMSRSLRSLDLLIDTERKFLLDDFF